MLTGDCLLGSNADIEVGIASPTDSCGKWIQNLAPIGLTWNYISQFALPGSAGTADGDTMQQVCDLTDGTEELYVLDAGGQAYGNDICSSEEQNGWTPETSPGPIAAEEQQAAQQAAQQQAQASASAASASAAQATAAAQASADAAAQQQAQNDLSALQGLSLSSDLSKLTGDLSQTGSDLAAEKTAAAAGPNADGGDCYNLTANVDYDAQDNVAYDAQDDFGYDLQDNLVPDIASMRQAISALQGDLSALQSLGLAAPSGAQGAINSAVSAANAGVSQENGYVSEAYSIASSIATGGCAGDGPGSPPSPLQDIS